MCKNNLERVYGVIHQGREKIKQVEQHDIMKKYFRQQFAEMEQKQMLLSQQLEIKLLSVSQQQEKLLSQLLSQQLLSQQSEKLLQLLLAPSPN